MDKRVIDRLYLIGGAAIIIIVLSCGLYYSVKVNGQISAELEQTQETLETYTNEMLRNKDLSETYKSKARKIEGRYDAVQKELKAAYQSNTAWAYERVPDAVINGLYGKNANGANVPSAGTDNNGDNPNASAGGQ